MNKETPSDKRRRDRVHRELREMLENGIKFIALWLLLWWASDHTRNVAASLILKIIGGLCFIPGALLRVICVLTNEENRDQIVKEVPLLDRFFGRIYGYRLAVIACILLLLTGMYLLVTYVHFT